MRARLGKPTAHQVELSNLDFASVGQGRRPLVQPTKGAGPILGIRPSECEMRMKGAGLAIESTDREGPLQILLQTTQGGRGLDSDPDHLRSTNRWKGSESADTKFENTGCLSNTPYRLFHSLNAVLRDITQELQSDVVFVGLDPTHREFRISEHTDRAVNAVPFLLWQIEGYEKTHGYGSHPGLFKDDSGPLGIGARQSRTCYNAAKNLPGCRGANNCRAPCWWLLTIRDGRRERALTQVDDSCGGIGQIDVGLTVDHIQHGLPEVLLNYSSPARLREEAQCQADTMI